MDTRPARVSGRLVLVGLIFVCLLGFAGTIWNYTRNNPMTSAARVESTGAQSFVRADFGSTQKIQVGQRVIVKIAGDNTTARSGIISACEKDGKVLIRIDARISAPSGATATASIDGTLAPDTFSK
jgi:multidrug resistance efflux pump